VVVNPSAGLRRREENCPQCTKKEQLQLKESHCEKKQAQQDGGVQAESLLAESGVQQCVPHQRKYDKRQKPEKHVEVAALQDIVGAFLPVSRPKIEFGVLGEQLQAPL
jgi:hypothetical protein